MTFLRYWNRKTMLLCQTLIVLMLLGGAFSEVQASRLFGDFASQREETPRSPRWGLSCFSSDDPEPSPDERRRMSVHLGAFGFAIEDTTQRSFWDEIKGAFSWVKEKIWGGGHTYTLPGHTEIHLKW